MSWVIPAVIAILMSTLVLAFGYYYLFTEYREKFMGVWFWSWILYALRFVFMLGYIMTGTQRYLLTMAELLTVASGLLLVIGAYIFVGRKYSVAWSVFAGVAMAWTVFISFLDAPVLVYASVTFLFSGLAYIWTGTIFLRHRVVETYGNSIIGWAFILWGIHKIDYPILRSVEWFAPWGYLIGATLTLVISIGILIVYFQKMGRDVQESEAKYRELVEHANSIIVKIDMQGRITFFNEYAQRLFGYSEEEAMGRSVLGTIVPEVDSLGNDLDIMLKNAIDRDEDYATNENENMKKDGSRLWISWSNRAIYDKRGNKQGLLCVGTNITEKKKAEDALRESNNFNQQIIQSAQDGIIVYDLNLKFLVWNPEMERISGTPASEVLGKHPLDIFPFLEETGLIEHLQQVIDTGAPNTQELQYNFQDIEKFRCYMDISAALRNHAGEIIGVIGIIRDITEKKTSEQMLKQREELLRRSQEVAHFGSWFLDLKKDRLTWSDENYRLFGFEPGEVDPTYDTFIQCVHPDDRDYVNETYRKAIETGTPYEVTHRILRKDGSQIVVSEVSEEIRDEDGKSVASIGMTLDITGRYKAEEALRKSEEKFRTLFDQSMAGIYLHDLEGRIIDVNDMGCVQAGYSREELLGMFVFDLHVPAPEVAREKIIEEWRKWPLHHRVSMETEHVRKDGTVYPVQLSTGVVSFEDGNLIMASVYDLTEKKLAEQEKGKLQQQLFHSQKMEAIGVLAGGVAHDFNNLLGIIMGSAQLAMFDVDEGGEVANELSVILESSRRAKDLTMKLLTFARKERITKTVNNVKGIIDDVSGILSRSLSKHIRLKCVVDDKINIVCDSNQLHQAIMNLCNNAADAMPSGGELVIECGKVSFADSVCDRCGRAMAGTYCQIQVSDTGMGIPKDLIEKVTDPFFTTKSIGKGTGLGLSVTHGIVESHSGHMHIDSKTGSGTSVKIFLPMSGDEQSEKIPEEEHDRNIGTEQILVIDDEIVLLEMAGRLLRRKGYDPLLASGGKKGIEMFRENANSISAVVLDFMMPDMDGPDVYTELRNIKPDVDVIFASGYSVDGQSHRIPGDHPFIQKPFDVEELCTSIRETIDGPH